jgi:hypothetical protein
MLNFLRRVIFYLLTTWWGTLILSFGRSWNAFTTLSVGDKERFLERWSHGWLVSLRSFSRLMRLLTGQFVFGHVRSDQLKQWMKVRHPSELLNSTWPMVSEIWFEYGYILD